MKSFFARYRESTLARNTVWMFLGQGLRIIVQAGYFIIIARSLGVQQYGAFMAVAATVGIIAPFIGIGSDKLIVKNVVRDRALLDVYFGNGVLMTLASGLAGVGFAVLICNRILPSSIPVDIILMVAIADLICYRLMDLAAAAFQSVEKLGITALITVLVSAARFLGIAVTALLLRHPTAEQWSFVYAGSTVVALVISLLWTMFLVKSFQVAPRRIRGELVEGFYFATGQSAQSVYNDVDKTMLASLSTLGANGIYAAAYRLIDVSFTPVRSLLFAAYPGYFRHGKGEISGAFKYAKRLLPRPLAFSLLVFVGLLVGAPLVPKILGSEYLRTVEALRWLAFLPFLKTLHYFMADTLTGTGFQGLRMRIQLGVAAFNVLLNLWIIPLYSWRGAAWSSLASDGLLALLMWFAIAALKRRQPAATVDPAPIVA